MNFGQALELLKHGKKVCRSGWNGQGMYIYLHKFPSTDIKAFLPCIVMSTAQKRLQPGWLASQADLLAEDWEIV